MIKRILTLLLVVLFTVISSAPSFALPPEQKKIFDSGILDFDIAAGCASGSSGLTGTGDSTNAGETYVAWNSGLQPPYIMEQFVIEVLKYIADFKNVPRENVVTREHTAALLAFALGEGGDIANSSRFNLFNTSALRDDPQAMPYAAGGVDGRLAYANFDVGIKATGGTMLEPRYTRIIDALLRKESTAQDVLYNYTHYSQFPGNGWWAEQNEIDGEEAYYQKELSLLRQINADYSIAATIIGTPEEEYFTKAKDDSKLVFSGAGAATITDGGSSSGACGASISGGTIVEIAEREFQAGANELDNSYHKYTTGRSEAWCAWFVSWVLKEAGIPFTGGIGEGGYAYPGVDGLHAMAVEKSHFHAVNETGFTPQPGDIAVYNNHVGDYPSHVNIVISYDSASATYVAIGGNEGGVYIKKRVHSMSSNSLTGFVRYP